MNDPTAVIKDIGKALHAVYEDPSIIKTIGEETIKQYKEQYNNLVNGTAEQTGEEIVNLTVEIAQIFGSGGTSKALEEFPAMTKIIEAVNNQRGSIKLGKDASELEFELPDMVVTAKKEGGTSVANNAKGAVEGVRSALVKDTGSISKNTENLRKWAKDN